MMINKKRKNVMRIKIFLVGNYHRHHHYHYRKRSNLRMDEEKKTFEFPSINDVSIIFWRRTKKVNSNTPYLLEISFFFSFKTTKTKEIELSSSFFFHFRFSLRQFNHIDACVLLLIGFLIILCFVLFRFVSHFTTFFSRKKRPYGLSPFHSIIVISCVFYLLKPRKKRLRQRWIKTTISPYVHSMYFLCGPYVYVWYDDLLLVVGGGKKRRWKSKIEEKKIGTLFDFLIFFWGGFFPFTQREKRKTRKTWLKDPRFVSFFLSRKRWW